MKQHTQSATTSCPFIDSCDANKLFLVWYKSYHTEKTNLCVTLKRNSNKKWKIIQDKKLDKLKGWRRIVDIV